MLRMEWRGILLSKELMIDCMTSLMLSRACAATCASSTAILVLEQELP
jgi:hypothetical protein